MAIDPITDLEEGAYEIIDDILLKLSARTKGLDWRSFPKSPYGRRAYELMVEYELLNYKVVSKTLNDLLISEKGDKCIIAGGFARYLQTLEEIPRETPQIEVTANTKQPNTMTVLVYLFIVVVIILIAYLFLS